MKIELPAVEAREDLSVLDTLFYPETVAVIGAGQDLFKPNGIPMVLYDLFGFKGKVYPVNPKYASVAGVQCYASVADIPGPVDLAVVAVPATLTMDVLRQCAAKGVKAAVVFTSGFAEVNQEGRQAQEEMAAFARETGLRILGPNCLGVINYYNGNTASFFFQDKPGELAYPRHLSFVTQSGGLGNIIYQMIVQYSVGFNYFISTGNEADISFAQVLNYLTHRREVTMIGGYLEGLHRDGKLFREACDRALANRQLVTLLKVGRTGGGAAAAASHTGALVGEDRVYDGLFRQLGVVRADEVEQMNALVLLHAAGRIPQGKRIAIITISGGGGVVVADLCAQFGLEVAHLTGKTQDKLREFFPAFGAVRNPVDLTSQLVMEPELFRRTIRLVMEDPQVDAGGFFYNLEMPNPEATRCIIEAYRQVDKPLAVFIWPTGADFALEAKKELIRAGVPVIEHIPSGLWAVAALADWTRKADKRRSCPAFLPGRERDGALQVVAGMTGRGALTEAASKKILAAYGIPVTREKTARTAEEAVQAASEIGYPVALKIESPDILHKTEAGGIRLNLHDANAVRAAYEAILAGVRRYKPEARINGVLIQEMLRPGLEVIVGVKKDSIFGPTVMFGLGGVLVEVLQDVVLRVAPLREQDAREMLREIRGRALLGSVRGQAPRDTEALVQILLKVSRLAVELEDSLQELDINPLIVYEEGAGAVAADALIVTI